MPTGPTPYAPPLPGFPDQTAYKQRLASEVTRLKSYEDTVLPQKRLDSDKEVVDIKLRFQGMANKGLIKRYGVSVYAKYDDTPEGQEHTNEVVLGKVSNRRLPQQDRSNYEQLSLDLDHYIETDEGKSKFGLIEELAPLDVKEVTDPELLTRLETQQDEEYVDIVFGDDRATSARKFEDMQDWLGDSFISEVNTDLVHYCRVHIDKDKLEEVVASYSGIIGVEKPIEVILSSGTQMAMDGNYELVDETEGSNPVLILDHPVNTAHPLLAPACLSQVGDAYVTGGETHGSQVASLVIHGIKLNSSGRLVLDNKVRPVNVFPLANGQRLLNEQALIDAVQQYSANDKVLIANFSVNNYGIYDRRKIHRLTVLLDELSVKHNCIFVVSAGNLFKGWPQPLIDQVLNIGYPTYFDSPITCILPPADGLNPISVGSIAYRSSPNSLAGPKEPTPITRRGFMKTKGYCLVKPDLVHYDSNYDTNYSSEDDGPFMAHPDGGLIRGPGTSFATPLVAHDLAMIAKKYPAYTANSLKALLIHFAQPLTSTQISDENMLKSMTGHGLPDLDRTLNSLSTSTTIVIEDTIKVNSRKRVKIPIPAVLAGSSRKRLRLRKTLVYNPLVNPVSPGLYNPILISAKIVRSDDQPVDNGTTQSYLDGAAKKANVKTYPAVEKNTKEHMGVFWQLEVTAEGVNDQVDSNLVQAYSVAVTIEDMTHNEATDIYQDITQMINVEVGVDVEL